MAKETKNVESVEITPENIVEQRKAGNILTPELKKLMDEKNKKEKDDKIIRETNRRCTYIGFKVDSGILEQKKMKANWELSKYNTTQLDRLMRMVAGFVVTAATIEHAKHYEDDVLKLEKVDKDKNTLIILVPETDKDGKIVRKEKTFKVGEEVPAVIDYAEFDDGTEILYKNLVDRQKKIDEQYKKDVTDIKKAAGEYWSDDWMYNARVVSADGSLDGRRRFY
jgi:hypothetical protein